MILYALYGSKKKKMKLKIFILLLLPVFSNAQQLPYQSAFNETSFIWNPAMTGRFQFMEFGATYRQQWMGFTDAPRTASLNIQFPLPNEKMSVGGFITRDQTGPLTYNSISFTYAFKMKLGIQRYDQLSIGLLGTLSEYHVDGRNVLVNDIDDVLLPNSESTQIHPNVGVGIFYQSYTKENFGRNFFYFGIAANQLLTSDLTFQESVSDLNLKRAFHGNAMLGIHLVYGDIFLEPSVWVNYAQINLTNYNLGLKMEKEDSFWTGFAFSSNSTLSLQAGVILKQKWLKDGSLRIGTMGTYNVGASGNYQGFGYEFYIAYRFDL